MEVLVQGAVNALGYLEDGKYNREPDCFETIRDLIRYLRVDTPQLTARIECGTHNIVKQDLIPLVKEDDVPDELFDVAIRLLVNLCQPAIASMQGKAPEDREQWQTYWKLEDNLIRAKDAFIDVKFFQILKEKLEGYFKKTDWEDREEGNRLVMERIVLLIRYVLSIKPNYKDNRRTTLEDNNHDRLIKAFLEAEFDQILLHIAADPKEKEFHVAIVDIFSLLLKEHTPELLLESDGIISDEARRKTEDEFKTILEKTSVQDAQKKKILSGRHSRFGGTYVMKGMKSISEKNETLVLKPIQDVNSFNFLNERKTKKTISRNRRPFDNAQETHVASMEVRQKLRVMVTRLVDQSFNRLMRSAKQLVFELKHVLHRNSQVNYFFLTRFVLRFVRLSKMSLDKINQCTGVEAFHENNVHLMEYVENATTLKGVEAKHMGVKAQYALSAYNELVLLHSYALESREEDDKAMARRALDHIFKVEEFRDLSATLIKKFSPAVLSKTFLGELIITTHNYFRLLEKFVKSGELKKVCTKKAVKNSKKKTVAKKPIDTDGREHLDKVNGEQLEKLWQTVEEGVCDVLRGTVEPIEDMSPMNVLLDVDDVTHQKFVMLNVQRAMRSASAPSAIGLYRAARKIWLEDDLFGKDDMSSEDELAELRNIFFADLRETATQLATAVEESNRKLDFGKSTEEDENDNDAEADSDDEEDVMKRYRVEEIEFDLDSYINRFAKVEVLRWYVFLLRDFEKNSKELNKAIVKMLHRVAFDLKMITKLFQLSLFETFAKVNSYLDVLPKEKQKSSPFYELFIFGFHLLKNFFSKVAAAEAPESLFMEALFWKGAKEVYEIDNGYGSYSRAKETEGRVWTDELEDEVKNLYDEYKDMEDKPEGVDVLDFIEHNLSRQRTRRQIFKKLHEVGLDLLGSKMKKVSELDATFPMTEMQSIHEEWKAMEGHEKIDAIDYIREKLQEDYGEYSRRRVLKHMLHAGILYEKPVKEKSLPKWSEEHVDELKALKEKYEEIDDAEMLLGVDIVGYIRSRMTERKPTSQIERFLRSMGVVVQERVKKQKTKKIDVNKFLEENKELIEEGEATGASDEKEKSDDDDDEDLDAYLKESDDEDIEEKQIETTSQIVNKFGLGNEDEPKKSLADLLTNRKRKLLHLEDDDSDDSDNDEDDEKAVEEKNDDDVEDDVIVKRPRMTPESDSERSESPKASSESPILSQKKRVVIESDDDE